MGTNHDGVFLVDYLGWLVAQFCVNRFGFDFLIEPRCIGYIAR